MANLSKAFTAKYGISIQELVGIFTTTTDPSLGDPAPKGSLMMHKPSDTTNGVLYLKFGVNDTDWVRLYDRKCEYSKTAAPLVTNDTTQGYTPGSIWIDTINKISYICVDATASNAIWTALKPPTISLTGDATGSGTTSIPVTLASVGTAGTYPKVTTDAKGRVISGTALIASDIPTLTSSKISDFNTSVTGTVISGFTVGANSTVTSADTVETSIEKLQAQINGKQSGQQWDGSAGADTINANRWSKIANITGLNSTYNRFSVIMAYSLYNGSIQNGFVSFIVTGSDASPAITIREYSFGTTNILLFQAVRNDIVWDIYGLLPNQNDWLYARSIESAGIGTVTWFNNQTPIVDPLGTKSTISLQPFNADLNAVAALSTTGVVKRTGAGSWTAAALVAGDIPNITESQVTNLTSDLALKANLASPTFTGTPRAPTPSNNEDVGTQLATTQFTNSPIAQTWHDWFVYKTPTQEFYDGTVWASETLDAELFGGKYNASSLNPTNSTTRLGTRWTFTGISYSYVSDIRFIYSYSGASALQNILVETSIDGIAWTTSASYASTPSWSTQGVLLRNISLLDSNVWMRLSMVWVSGTGSPTLMRIEGLTRRVDAGSEFAKYPYSWNAVKDVVFPGVLSTSSVPLASDNSTRVATTSFVNSFANVNTSSILVTTNSPSKNNASALNSSVAQGWTKLFSWTPVAFAKRSIYCTVSTMARDKYFATMQVSFMQEGTNSTISDSSVDWYCNTDIVVPSTSLVLMYNTTSNLIELWFNDTMTSNSQWGFSIVKASRDLPTSYYGVSAALPTVTSYTKYGTHYKYFTSVDYTDLTDTGDSALHYHATDRNRTNHTGTQLAATISDFNTAVTTTVISGFTLGANSTVTIADTVETAIEKLQSQMNNKTATNTAITAGTATKITYDAKGLILSGTALIASDIPSHTVSLLSDFSTAVPNVVLATYSSGSNTSITNADSIVTAFGKVQAMISGDRGNLALKELMIPTNTVKLVTIATTTYMLIGTYTFPGTTLTFKSCVFDISSDEVQNGSHAIVHIDLRRNANSFAAGYVNISINSTMGIIAPDSFIITTTGLATDSGLTYNLFIKASPSAYPFYVIKSIRGDFGFTAVTNTLYDALPAYNSSIASTITGWVSAANILKTTRSISITGDATWTSNFDGSTNVTAALTLASVGTAGTYTKVTTDAKGRITSGTTLSASDLPSTLNASTISGALTTADWVLTALVGSPTYSAQYTNQVVASALNYSLMSSKDANTTQLNALTTANISINNAAIISVVAATTSIVNNVAMNQVTSPSLFIGDGATSTNPSLYLQGLSGNDRRIVFRTGNNYRWTIITNSTAETGSDIGSDFALRAYTDAGGSIDTAFSIARNAGGLISLNRNTIVSIGSAPYLSVGNNTATTPQVIVTGISGAAKQLALRTANSNRWTVTSSNVAESGSNAGSSFDISAYDDTGIWIDTPISVTRVAGGNIGITRPITTSGNITMNNVTGPVFNLGVNTTTFPSFVLNGAAATNKAIRFFTAGLGRWGIFADSAAESGSDAGTNFSLQAYSDAGVWIDSPITITRALTGLMTVSRSIAITTVTSPTITLGGNTSTSPVLRINGATGNSKLINVRTAGSERWFFGGDNVAESGSDAGTQFIMSAYSDTGTYIDTPITIKRTLGANITVIRPITTTGNITLTGLTPQVNIGDATSTSPRVYISGLAGYNRLTVYRTGVSARWALGATTDTETGTANTGSSFMIGAYDDTGTYIDTPITIPRALGGAIAITRPITTTANLTLPTSTAATAGLNIGIFGVVPTTPVVGDVYWSTTDILSIKSGTAVRTVAFMESPMTTYAVGTNTALANTDSIIGAMGKIQGQLNTTLKATYEGELYLPDIAVNAVSTTNVAALTGIATTVDGILLNTIGKLVLLKDQTTQTQNGVYVIQSGAWTRATGSDIDAEIRQRLVICIADGTVNKNGYEWVCTNTTAITIGTTNITFAQVPNGIGATAVQAAAGNHTHSYAALTGAAFTGAVTAPQFGATVQTSATTTGVITWTLTSGSSMYLSAALTGAITLNITVPVVGSMSVLMFTQGTTAQTVTLSMTNVVFRQVGATGTSTFNVSGLTTVSAYYRVELNWVTALLCYVSVYSDAAGTNINTSITSQTKVGDLTIDKVAAGTLFEAKNNGTSKFLVTNAAITATVPIVTGKFLSVGTTRQDSSYSGYDGVISMGAYATVRSQSNKTISILTNSYYNGTSNIAIANSNAVAIDLQCGNGVGSDGFFFRTAPIVAAGSAQAFVSMMEVRPEAITANVQITQSTASGDSILSVKAVGTGSAYTSYYNGSTLVGFIGTVGNATDFYAMSPAGAMFIGSQTAGQAIHLKIAAVEPMTLTNAAITASVPLVGKYYACNSVLGDVQDGAPWYGVGYSTVAAGGGFLTQLAGYHGVRIRSSTATLDVLPTLITASVPINMTGIQVISGSSSYVSSNNGYMGSLGGNMIIASSGASSDLLIQTEANGRTINFKTGASPAQRLAITDTTITSTLPIIGMGITTLQNGWSNLGSGTNNHAVIRHQSRADDYRDGCIYLDSAGNVSMNALAGKVLYLGTGNNGQFILSDSKITSTFPIYSPINIRRIVTSNTTTDTLSTDQLVVFTGTLTHTFRLPDTSTIAPGCQIIIKNISTAGISIQCVSGSDMIDGLSSYGLGSYQSITVVNILNNWLII